VSIIEEKKTMPPNHLPDPVQYAIPGFVALIILEMLLGKLRHKADYEIRDTIASLMMGFGNLLTKLLTGFITLAVSVWVYQHRLWTVPFTWWAFVLIFFAEDLCYYWFHRISHESRWLWAAHVNHHSSQHYNLSTALRQTWTGFLSGGWLLWLPLALLGFHPALIAFQAGVSLVYQFWIHTEAIDRLGPLEWILNTPSHHRVHHAINLKYLDKNYGGILILWDRIFGTFEAEDPNEPCEYGILKPLATFNPILIAFHEWVAIFQDALKSNPLSVRLRYLFGRPGWSPDGSTLTVPQMRAAQQQNQNHP